MKRFNLFVVLYTQISLCLSPNNVDLLIVQWNLTIRPPTTKLKVSAHAGIALILKQNSTGGDLWPINKWSLL